MSSCLASRARQLAGPRLPSRYLEFLEHQEYDGLEYLHLLSHSFDGWFLPNFCDIRGLHDLTQLGHLSGVAELRRETWDASFPNLAPIAVLETVSHRHRRQLAGGFLAMGLQPGPCAIHLVTHVARPSIPVAKSLDTFIRGHLWRDRTANAPKFQLAYRWAPRPIGLVPQPSTIE